VLSFANRQVKSAGHSVVLKEKEFVPWIPFSNHHSSKPIEVCFVIDCTHINASTFTFLQPAACPLLPAKNYPKAYSMIDVTNNWNTDSTEIPAMHYDSLCHFDYKNATQLKQSQNYRLAEVIAIYAFRFN